MLSEIFIRKEEPIGRINSNIYGHFAEHLGRCIYDGIWVGENSSIENKNGIRSDTIELLSELNMPVLRWPGGCFADDYHWKDGIGPKGDRPRRRNLWWAQGREHQPEESNHFGTDEFIRFCDLIDAEPYLAVNIGSSDPQEAVDWVEYCNYEGDTELTDYRRENTQLEDTDGYNVTYWGVGNENWGCGGRYSPEEYAGAFRRFATYLRGFDRLLGQEPLELVACGHITDNWNQKFLNQLEKAVEWRANSPLALIDHLSVHRYYEAGGNTDFSDEQYYKLFSRAQKVALDVDRAQEAINLFGGSKSVGIIIDEWGVWHPEAVAANGLEQENTIRDALTAACVLNDFNTRADIISMANIAQTVNVLQCLVQTNQDTAWATPTYQVFDLYQEHMDATSIQTSVNTDVKKFESESNDVPIISASSSWKDKEIFTTIVNRHRHQTREVKIDFGIEDISLSSCRVLFNGNKPEEYSTETNAHKFAPEEFDVDEIGKRHCSLQIPASSVVGLSINKA